MSYSYSLLLNYLLQKVVLAKVLHRFNISYTAVSHSAFCTPCGGPASCVFPMVLRSGASRSATLHRRPAQKQLRNGGPASCVFPMVLRSATSAISLFPMVLRNSGLASCVFLMVLLPASPPRRPGQQHLPDSSLPQCRHPLRHGPRPATNLIRRRRSPVWLAIWRTWAGFANSQHRDAAFATPDNICAHSSLLPH